MKSSEMAGITILQIVGIGFWFLIGANILGWINVCTLVWTLFVVASSND